MLWLCGVVLLQQGRGKPFPEGLPSSDSALTGQAAQAGLHFNVSRKPGSTILQGIQHQLDAQVCILAVLLLSVLHGGFTSLLGGLKLSM